MLASDLDSLQSHFEEKELYEKPKTARYYIPPCDSRPLSNVSRIPSDNQLSEKKELQEGLSKYSWRFYGTFACLCLVNLVCALDATILSVALPTIANDLHGTAIEAFWSVTSFLLTSTVFQPIWAAFSQILGRKPMLLGALFLFVLGTIICAIAHSFTVLIVGRSIQGVGGGGLAGLTYVIVADLVPLRERGKWMSVITLQWAIGSVCGPVIGGVIALRSTWPWIFWINIPICALAFVGIPICLKLSPLQGSMVTKLKNFDWVGSFLLVSSITIFLIPLTWGGVMFDWDSWRTLLPLILGVMGTAGYAIYTKFIATNPVVRGSIFSTSTSRMGYFGTFIHGVILWSMLFYLPLYYELAKDFDPVTSGVAMFTNTFTTAPAAVVVGLIITRTGKYRPSIYIGWFLTTLGVGLLILLSPQTPTASWICITLVSGVGTGMLYSAQSFAVQASASNTDLPFAAAMYSFFRSFGQAFGVAVGGVVFQNILQGKLAASANTVIAANAFDWAKDASRLVQIMKAMPASDLKSEVIEAYVQSLKVVWIVMCALSGMVFLMSLIWIKDISLDRELETEQGFRHRKEGDQESS